MNQKRVAIVGGARTPFQRSGTGFSEVRSLDLSSELLRHGIEKAGLAPEAIDEVQWGTVLLNPRTPNLARELVFKAGLPHSIPAHFVSNNCISGLVTASFIRDGIVAGRIATGLAGGVESMSLPALTLRDSSERLFIKLSRAKTFGEKLGLIAQLRLKHVLPVPPSPKEPSTGLTMGEHCEITAKRFLIARNAQDAYACSSHQKAVAARDAGFFKEDIVPVFGMGVDNLVRGDTTLEKLSALKPVFDKTSSGTITAGNASALTDGASFVTLASEEYCDKNHIAPLGYIKDVIFTALSPDQGLLMAPGLALPRLLHRNGLTVADIDIFEIHEAFAAQVLANMHVWQNGWQEFPDLAPIGSIPAEKINPWGGSLALGHPFAATGGRLLLQLCRELDKRNAKRGVISVCAAGGMAAAVLVER